jgi:hypothetical protein
MTCHRLDYYIDDLTQDWLKDQRQLDQPLRVNTIRSTWATLVPKVSDPELTLKFFYGNRLRTQGAKSNQNPRTVAVTGPDRQPLEDEIFLSCGDQYTQNPAKMKAICKYALDNGYDYIVRCDDDTYFDAVKFFKLNWQHDYAGSPNGTFVPGGCMTLSAAAMKAIIAAPITNYADDLWIGGVMEQKGMIAFRHPEVQNGFGKSYNIVPSAFNLDRFASFHSCKPAVQKEIFDEQWGSMSQVQPKLKPIPGRPPILRQPRNGRYAADGLTQDWGYQTYPEWWTHNIDGKRGVSYCIVNAKGNFAAAFKAHIAPLMVGHDYEVLEFLDEPKISDLFPYCTYHWIMVVDVTPHVTLTDYQPKVSIIMGTYRRQHIIGRTVETLLAQDYANWELIVINNESGGKVDLPDDSRIKIYEHSAQANPCYAKNGGYQYVTGDLVCCFDDDNDMLPGYLSKMVAPFADPLVKVVHCGMRLPTGVCDFSYDTQEAWLRKEDATPTWTPGSLVHDQLYYRGIIAKKRWTRDNIVQLGEVLIQAHTDPKGGMREGGF